MENFILSKTNPNDSTGGKGCLCSNRETADCKPPFVVFQGPKLQDRHSPFPVACQNCISQALKGMEQTSELQTIGYADDARPNLGTVTPESIDVVAKIMDENWIPEPGEDYVPPDLASKLAPEPEAKTMTVEEHVEERDATEPVRVPSL